MPQSQEDGSPDAEAGEPPLEGDDLGLPAPQAEDVMDAEDEVSSAGSAAGRTMDLDSGNENSDWSDIVD